MTTLLNRLTAVAAVALATGLPALASAAGALGQGAMAPEFSGIDQWLNSEPLSIKQLQGKVVLVDFWTYSCINCVNTLPHVKAWYQKYQPQGLVVVGVHTPEFPFERNTDNVRTALKRFDIRYPVAQDNRYATWDAYGNRYWPATYLFDKSGKLVYTHFGEGAYAQTEAKIQALLAEVKP
jgi:thiol-disulfide isomerase/thioredoxin